MGASYGLAGVQPSPVLDQHQGASPYIRENPLLLQQTGGQGTGRLGLYSGPCPEVIATSTPPQSIEQWKQEGYSQGLMEGISMTRKEIAQMNPQASRGGDDTYARTTGAGIPLTPAAGSTTGGSQDSPGRRGRKGNGRRRRREQDTHSFLSMGGQSDSDGSDTAGSLPSPVPYARRSGPLRTNIDPPDNKATFNGTHWKGFICLLEEQAAEYGWDKDVKLSRFRKALKGPAADFFSTLPQATRRDYNLLKTRFQRHYEPKELPLVARWEALLASQRVDETIYEFKVRVDELLQKASENPEQTIGHEIFLKGLLDRDLALVAFQQNPATLEDAYQAVTSMVSLRKGLGAPRKSSRSVKLDDSDDEKASILRAVREMTVAFQRSSEQASGSKNPNNVQQSRTPPRRGCFNCGQGGHMRNECTSPGRLCYNCGGLNHLQRDCTVPPKCHACGGQGHYIRDCPRRDDRYDQQKGMRYSPSRGGYRAPLGGSPMRSGYGPSYQQQGGSPGRYYNSAGSYQSWRGSPRGNQYRRPYSNSSYNSSPQRNRYQPSETEPKRQYSPGGRPENSYGNEGQNEKSDTKVKSRTFYGSPPAVTRTDTGAESPKRPLNH